MTEEEQRIQKLYTDWRNDKYYPRISTIEKMGRFILEWDSGLRGAPCKAATEAGRAILMKSALELFPELIGGDLLAGMLVQVNADREAREGKLCTA